MVVLIADLFLDLILTDFSRVLLKAFKTGFGFLNFNLSKSLSYSKYFCKLFSFNNRISTIRLET